MRVFAIADMHLAGDTEKTMDRFGEHWKDHDRKIFEAWERIGKAEDTLLIVGDTSWAMKLEGARPDLERVGRMKGTKLLFKGNHDYWWESAAKMRRMLDPSIKVLNAGSIIINRVAVAGTRGWTCPDDSHFEEPDRKIYEREVGRLKAALSSLDDRLSEFDKLIVALHYPPVNDKHDSSGFTEIIDQYQVDDCVYGHLHGDSIPGALSGVRARTAYHLVSADAVGFAPVEIQVGGDA
jgi:uncharacterized protein